MSEPLTSEDRETVKEIDDAMRLPLGATCNDCAHGKRCFGLGYSWPERTQCDFYPNSFRQKQSKENP